MPGCPPNTDFTDARSALRLVLHHGSVQEYWLSSAPGATPDLGWVGGYHVFKDRVDFTDPVGAAQFSTSWKVDGKQLTLSDMKPFVCGDANVWVVRPWTRVS